MKLSGLYRFSNNNWIGNISELGIIQIGKTRDEFFKKLQNEINSIINSNSFDKAYEINLVDDQSFKIKFFDHKTFAAFIFKAIRKKEKMSQANVASKLDIVRTSYSQYEEEKKEPTLGKFSEVLRALGYECEINIKKLSSL